jgi:DNA-binding MarR family transcriptional regulator
MASKFKRKGKGKFIMIEAYVKRSAGWKALTPIERSAYIEVKWRYDGLNNGRIGLGCRELADELNMGRDTAVRALNGLQEKGFIAKVKASAFNVKNRTATEWRLTEHKCDVTGEFATKDFLRWQPHEKTTVAPIGHTVRPNGHKAPEREEKHA